MKNPGRAFILVAVMTALVAGFSSCSKKAAEPQAPAAQETAAPKPAVEGAKVATIPQSGESKEAGMFSFRIDGLKLIKIYDAAFTAGEGKIYVEVEYSIKNNTDAVQTYATMLSNLKLTDPAGKAYDYVAGLGNWIETQGAKDGKIAAKAETKVSCIFEVPGDSSLSLSGWKFDVGNCDLNAPASVTFFLK